MTEFFLKILVPWGAPGAEVPQDYVESDMNGKRDFREFAKISY